MSLETIIYLADVLPNIVGAAIGILFFALASPLLYFLIFLAPADESTPAFKYPYKPILIIIIVCVLLAIFIPTKETIYMMAGVSATKQIANTPEAEKALKVLDLGLDKAISKLQDK